MHNPLLSLRDRTPDITSRPMDCLPRKAISAVRRVQELRQSLERAERRVAVIQMAQNGFPHREIATRVGASRQAVTGQLNRLGIRRYNVGGQRPRTVSGFDMDKL